MWDPGPDWNFRIIPGISSPKFRSGLYRHDVSIEIIFPEASSPTTVACAWNNSHSEPILNLITSDSN